MTATDKQIEACARAAHEMNRAYCIAIGDDSQVVWEYAPDWQKDSAYNGAKGVLAGNDERASHESWLAEKRATGWKYGPVKDPEKKEHPCFVDYDDLSVEQRHKDGIFVAAVRTMAAALGMTVVYPARGNFKRRMVDWATGEMRTLAE